MKRIYLHGALKKQFGAFYDFDVPSPAMAFSALRTQLKGFAAAVRDGKYIIIRGKKRAGYSIDETQFHLKFGRTSELHIIPAVRGAGGKAMSIVKIVLGVALLAVGVGGAFLAAGAVGLAGTAISLGALGGITWGTVAGIGVTLLVTGVSSMLTPKANLSGPSYQEREAPDARASFLFNGPRNRTAQGQPVAVAYGRIMLGSQIISSGLSTEQV